MSKPNMNSAGERELDKVQKQFDAFDKEVQDLTQDRMNAAPKLDVEPQTKIAQVDIDKSKETYLKPSRAIGSKEVFNEKWRDRYNFDKEYVHFIAENKEIIGETIEMWTKPYPGCPAEQWKVPVNKPVWGPRYLAEQIKGRTYHRLSMENKPIGSDHAAQYYGNLVVDNTVQRLDAYPVNTKRSIFMSTNNF